MEHKETEENAMKKYTDMSLQERQAEYAAVQAEYKKLKAMGLGTEEIAGYFASGGEVTELLAMLEEHSLIYDPRLMRDMDRAVGRISAEHLRGKIIVTVGGNKTVAAAPGRRQRSAPEPGVGPGETLQRLRTRILMVVGHAGDIEPYPTMGRAGFIPRRVPPPERYLDGAIHCAALRPPQGLPPLLASCP